MKLLIGAIALMTLSGGPNMTPPEPAKCNPSGVCTACSSCSSCKHCSKEGGSCSVCRGSGSPQPAKAPPAAAIAGRPRVDYQGRVISVQDGDTLTIEVQATKHKIRLFGIDAPEDGQAFSNVAKKHLTGLALNRVVDIEKRDVDRYQRIVGIVRLEGRNLNADMVGAGYAWWYKKYAPKETALQKLEKDARAARRGLWKDKSPIPPWEWRGLEVFELAPCCQ